MRRMWGLDVLVCPRCEGPMRFVAAITNRLPVARVRVDVVAGASDHPIANASLSSPACHLPHPPRHPTARPRQHLALDELDLELYHLLAHLAAHGKVVYR